jgi:hypothetical protein
MRSKDTKQRKVTKILAVNYYYYPKNAIGARRIINIVSQLSSQLNPAKVLVLSTANHLNEQSSELPPAHTAKPLATLDLSNFSNWKKKWFERKKGIRITDSAPAAPTNSQNAFRLRHAKLFKSIPGNLIFGEGGWLYVMTGFFKGLRFINNDTVIFTSFSPLSDHLIAFLLKIFFPKAIWIADFRDLYIQKEVPDIYAFSFHKWFFRRLLKRADLVTTVSSGLAKGLQGFSSNVRILTNGIGNYQNQKIPGTRNFAKFRISYTGSLYGYKRSPEVIFKSLKNALGKGLVDKNDLEIIYAGNEGALWGEYITKFDLNMVSISLGKIDRRAAVRLQQDSIVNIVITWSDEHNKGILTGKFFEYIEAGNLILVLINGERDEEFEKLVSETGVGDFFYSTDSDRLEDYICKKYHEWKLNGYLKTSYNQTELQKFTWEHQISEAIIKPLNLEVDRKPVQLQLQN